MLKVLRNACKSEIILNLKQCLRFSLWYQWYSSETLCSRDPVEAGSARGWVWVWNEGDSVTGRRRSRLGGWEPLSDMTSGGTLENWGGGGGVCLLHNAAGDSLLSVHNSNKSLRAFRWGVEQQAEARRSTLVLLRRSQDFVDNTPTPASGLTIKNSLDIFVCLLRVWLSVLKWHQTGEHHRQLWKQREIRPQLELRNIYCDVAWISRAINLLEWLVLLMV